MAGIRINLDTQRLDQLRGELRPSTDRVLDKTARDLEDGTKAQILIMDVVDLHNLQNSIQVRAEHKPLERIVSDATEYGLYQHDGYHDRGGNYHPGRPFMRVAADRLRKPFIDALKALFQ